MAYLGSSPRTALEVPSATVDKGANNREDYPELYSEDDDCIDEEDLFGQHQQRLQEQAFDFSLQRWYDEPKSCPKFPPPPITDLQTLENSEDFNDRSRISDVKLRKAGRPPPLRTAKKEKKLQFPTGVHVEVPLIPDGVMDREPAENVPTLSVAESEIFDRNFNHQYAYNQAALDHTDRALDVDEKNFTGETRRMIEHLLGRPENDPPPKGGEIPTTGSRRVGNALGKEGESGRNVERKKGSNGKFRDIKEKILEERQFYKPSNLPKLGVRFGVPVLRSKQTEPPSGLSPAEQKEKIENNWSPGQWTLEDEGWTVGSSPDLRNVIPGSVGKSFHASASDPFIPGSTAAQSPPTKKPSLEAKVFKFPQDNFCTTITEESFTRHTQEAETLTGKLTEKGARLRVALPSGSTLRVPLAAAKMFDHSLPDVAATGHGVTFADVKARLDKEQRELNRMGEHMVKGEVLERLKDRPSLVVKQQQYANLVQGRALHQPSDVGQVRALQFASAPVDDDAFRKDIQYQKLDLSQIVQTVPVKDESEQLDRMGNAHECVRQYLKDHKMDDTAQLLSQEWWQHHDERCREFPHGTKPYQAVRQYLDLVQSHTLLLNEYKAVQQKERKKTRLVNQCQLNLRFMTLNFKRYAAKNAKLQADLEQARKISPVDYENLLLERNQIDQRFRGLRQLTRNLHAQLKARRAQTHQLIFKLNNQRASLRFRKSRKANPDDSVFPDYHGLNPLGFLVRKKPVQLLKQNGMSIQQKTPAHTRAVNDMTINPFRHMVVTAGADGQWRAWDVKAMGKPLFEGNGHNGSIYRTAYHPSGSFFATGGMDAVVNFWSTSDGSRRLKVKHLQPVTALSFHSSGDFMLTGCNNGNLALWDLNSQRCLSHLCRWNSINRVHKGAIANCQIIPYSNMCISASEDGDVRLWDLRTESNRIIMGQSQPIRNAKVALNGHIMVTSSKYDSEVKLWDLRKLGQLVSVANYSPQFICDFNFDTSSHLVALALNNGQVNFWDMKTGTSIVYPAHNSSTTVVTWDIWGEYMLSGDEQGNIFLWS
ncbi:putative Sperm-associated antigen 16 protein [Hypsibius exemplaris]|uniref:Sperm-associated antigen 16 protein n=1 Tax=Hypsibius exemplaris TaxID=2072580 RepID=A0A1W0WR42_HYPEX|nr:putative Sperm-associated antigen 16 protein [Hypsibius exemplaris]